MVDRIDSSRIRVLVEVNEGDLYYLAKEKPRGAELYAIEASIGIWVNDRSIFRDLPFVVSDVRGDLCVNIPVFEFMEEMLLAVFGIASGKVDEAVVDIQATPLALRIRRIDGDVEIDVLFSPQYIASESTSIYAADTDFQSFAVEATETVSETLKKIESMDPDIRTEPSLVSLARLLSRTKKFL